MTDATESSKITVIQSVEDILTAARELRVLHGGDVWWRGQPWSGLTLRPKLFRREDYSVAEGQLFARFQRQAYVRYSPCPPTEASMDWLTLMQHHGLATRLLDWTFSPLIAAFFAVRNRPDPIPSDWNAETPNPELFAYAPHNIWHQQDAEVLIDTDVEEVRSFIPDEKSQRMFVQQSGFTIHGNAMPLSETVVTGALNSYEIEETARAEIARDLRKLGIRESTLFPDLDHLAADLNSLIWQEK